MISIARPLLGQEEAEAAGRVILSGWLSQGPEVAAFEQEFAEAVGAKHACAVANCTVALHLALLAVGVKPGSEVITASHTFIACANAIRQCGATPIFVDIDPSTFCMSCEAIEKAITPRTSAILGVHQMGMPFDVAAVLATAERHNVPLVEDAACAVGTQVLIGDRWASVGRPHGVVACFSLHPRKVLTVGDGGVLTTNDTELDQTFRLLRQHGMDISDTVRHGSRTVLYEKYVVPAYNYRMTDIQAAVGREQLKRLPSLIECRRAAAEGYRHLLAPIPGLTLPFEPEWARSNWQSYCVRLPAEVDQRVGDGGYARSRDFDAARHYVHSQGTGLFRHQPAMGSQRIRTRAG